MRLNELYDDDFVTEGPVWDKVKRQAAGAALAGGLVGAAVHGLGNKPSDVARTPEPAAQVQTIAPAQVPAEKPVDTTAKAEKSKNIQHTSQIVNRDNQNRLVTYAAKNGIKGLELAALLAQSAHETLGFHKMAETGSREYFAKYEGKLGNDRPGDGYRYRGRTFLHITGKENYNKIGKAIGVDLVKHPELLERPEIGLKASIWYWNNRVKPYVSDFNDVIAITQRIQGGSEGLGDRAANFEDFKKKLKL